MKPARVLFVLATIFCMAMAEVAPTIGLNDGYSIPLLALGTYGSSKDIARLREATVWAIEAGYRHIDTAALYKNEDKIGEGIADAVKKGLVKRDQLFITTKLWNDKHGRDQVVPALKESLNKLGVDYVPGYQSKVLSLLSLMKTQNDQIIQMLKQNKNCQGTLKEDFKFPIKTAAELHATEQLLLLKENYDNLSDGTPADIDILETWEGMVECKKLGLARSIGVSNFNTKQMDKLIAKSKVPPAVNQIEVHPANTQEQLVSDCHSRNITVMAYSPFGFLVSRDKKDAPAPRIDDPKLVEIAKKYNKTTSQLVLRYLIDRYLIPIPKSTNKKRLEENIDVFDFRLTDEDIDSINKFNSNTSVFDD